MTNFSASRFNGGLNLAANLVGKPGKMGIAGHMVQDLYNEGQLQRINDYCRCDVLDTYFVLLRTKILTGEISLEKETELIAEATAWLEERAEEFPVYREYLEQCTPW
jgi:predicted PolB exonuclease-like 3'-5' exonuclease